MEGSSREEDCVTVHNVSDMKTSHGSDYIISVMSHGATVFWGKLYGKAGFEKVLAQNQNIVHSASSMMMSK